MARCLFIQPCSRKPNWQSFSVLAILIVAATALAQSANALSKPQKPKGTKTVGLARNPKDMTSGMILGSNWMVTFRGMPTGWTAETKLANQIGVQEIFHPPHWDAQRIAPSIIFSFSEKEPGCETPVENVAIDEKRAKAQFPDGKVLLEPALVIGTTQKAPVRIYEYPHGWDMVVYSEDADLLYVTTLHCINVVQCAPFKNFFAKFVSSLDYTGNVTVLRGKKHQ